MSQARVAEKEVGSETYGFDAIRGIQAGREFYVAMCPLKIIPKLFLFNEHDIPPELRSQRTLRESRIPALKNYILENPEDYIFSSLTSSVDGMMKFFPAPALGDDSKLGRLYINMDARLLINDGQHRRKAIEEALKERPDLGHETISVVFFQDQGLERSQQIFSDLNKNAVKPTKSLNILYDHRDPFGNYVKELITKLELFKDRVEVEKTTLSNRTTKIFTLNGVLDCSKRFLGLSKLRAISAKEKSNLKEFWSTITKNIPQWQLAMRGEIEPSDLRQNYVNGHTNVLNVLGVVGNYIFNKYPDNWKEKLAKLQDIDWREENPEWDGRLVIGGRMVKNSLGIELAANTILQKMGIKLDEHRQSYERQK